jgi:hypothetical protein
MYLKSLENSAFKPSHFELTQKSPFELPPTSSPMFLALEGIKNYPVSRRVPESLKHFPKKS